MAITLLQEDTVRAIGSTSAVPDPCSVVKELVDNALDANATSVSIEMSSNTLDIILVKDNGVGIPCEDRPLVCKRNHTSKIQTLQNLRQLGGSSLGFRGQALASIAEVSGALQITTRGETEQVASVLKFGRDGEVLSTDRASHPTGTTVRVLDFFKFLPVRRKTALKYCGNHISKIKKLLHVFAIARPSIRFSLRVLKSKDENAWIYAPGPRPSITDAILKIAGPEVVACCTRRFLSSQADSEDNLEEIDPVDSNQASGYSNPHRVQLSVMLPKPGADRAKVSRKGQYIIVDGRAMSTTKGIAKTIVNLFKSYVQEVLFKGQTETTVADPFLYLHVYCPPGSYDINVEPSKDDVLFENAQLILSLTESLFKGLYGEQLSGTQGRLNHHGNSPSLQLVGDRPDGSRNTSCSPADGTNQQPTKLGSRTQQEIPSTLSTRLLTTPRAKRPGIAQSSNSILDSTVTTDPTSINPWTLARLRAQDVSSRDPYSHLLTPRREAGSPPSSNMIERTASFGTDSSIYPMRQYKPPTCLREPVTPRNKYTRNNDDSRNSTLARNFFGGQLGNGFEGRATESSRQPQAMNEPEQNISNECVHNENYTFEDAIDGRFGESPRVPRVISDVSITEVLGEPPTPRQQNQGGLSFLYGESEINFEHRKKATEQVRGEPQAERPYLSQHASLMGNISLSSDQGMASPPPSNRHVASSPSISSNISHFKSTAAAHTKVDSIIPKLNPLDPRAYYIRHLNDHHTSKPSQGTMGIRHTIIDRLPLESIAPGTSTQHITMLCRENMKELSTHSLRETDAYINSGRIPEAFSQPCTTEDVVKHWTAQLLALIKRQYALDIAEGDIPTQFNLQNAIEVRPCQNSA